jgi:ribosomal protein S18 acetylase RimI-like enzyme
MSGKVEFGLNRASEVQIAEHLTRSDADFVPPLSGRVAISDYARKIAKLAERFEAWSEGTLIGLVAIYCNDLKTRVAHITSVSVLNQWTGKGIASQLMEQSIDHAKAAGMRKIVLDVAKENVPAISLYEKYGFIAGETGTTMTSMDLNLKGGD